MPSFKEKEQSIQLSREFGKQVNYGLSALVKHKKVNDMYPLNWNDFDHSDVETGLNKVLGPLSLFAPFSHDDASPKVEQLQLERPVTPIDEEIKVQPKTIDKMIHHIRRRVMAKPNIPFLTIEDQKNLSAIIMGEVNGIWSDIKRQIDDPFLTAQENKELSRQISVHIVTVCEKLFHHYLHKAQVLNSRGVFSGPANMSRLKVQLALEAGELLNVLKIQRYIVNDIRMSAAGLNAEAETDTSCSRTKLNQIKANTVEHEIKEMQNSMPVLNTDHLIKLLAEFPERDVQLPSHEEHHLKPNHMTQGISHLSGAFKETISKQKTFKRSYSQPLFNETGNLLEELCIDCKVKEDNLMELELRLLQSERERIKIVETNKETDIQLGCHDIMKNDLKKLTECKKDEFLDGSIEGDMPPLIQAIIRHARHDDLKQRMEKQLTELEDRQKMRNEEESIHVRGPVHPQPDTVSAKLGNAGVVRTSDIRVSERVCMSSITLRRHASLYNDLLDEIDQVTVRNLDTNLFLSDEIQEVYKEIMKTATATHMDMDDDPRVLDAPYSVELMNTTASATLSHKVLNRIINPSLIKNKGPPWAGSDMKEWARTPVKPPKNIRGEDMFAAFNPDLTRISDVMHGFSQVMQTGKPNFAEDKMSRAWLQWWKSILSSDDYMKYLFTQETDFLGAVFHFYDSEEEDDESESEDLPNKLHHFSRRIQSNKRSKVSAVQKEKLRKLEELQNMKSEYKTGFWNTNTVLMGGLGKDPELLEDKHNKSGASKPLESRHQKGASNLRIAPEKRDHVKSMSKTISGTFEGPAPQDRLENVWQKLHMPDSHRLDMAIKYSCNNYFSKLAEAIEKWEFVSELILQRETLLTKLEEFERQASDPNRFFHKDSKNSIYRLEESRQRTHLYKKIDALDVAIKEGLEYIHNQFQDVVTYKGRPYIDKMKWDRTEMLYWLSEERKQNGLKYEAMLQGLNLPFRSAHLQPIMSSKTLQL